MGAKALRELAEIEARLAQIAQRIRVTATELEQKRIHPAHAANRFKLIANELSPSPRRATD